MADVEAAAKVITDGRTGEIKLSDDEIKQLAGTDAPEQLERTLNDFRLRVREVIGTGVAKGESIGRIRATLRKQENLTTTAAERIVRTEVLTAYNRVNDDMLERFGVDYVMFTATEDDRTCPWCAERAGNIYERGDIILPLHPNCRCFLVPVNLDDERQLAWADRHFKEATEGIPPEKLRRDAAPFERLTGQAPEPFRRSTAT